ncbi:hypothetical protein F9288_10050 [Sphingomonas sp. CL5.1]|uniref:hypothetical protein n=1 Tax=Sphingomonas sp. CL5.1 TaxID=2653203 RepID=UPI0015832CB0|nr:hypothetical protein [Sphingomonas sp. CL5.1]QKR99939.1 hypothetical protein F9288_10050 [Sphingomonas sp. CL5.1]
MAQLLSDLPAARDEYALPISLDITDHDLLHLREAGARRGQHEDHSTDFAILVEVGSRADNFPNHLIRENLVLELLPAWWTPR